MIALALCLLAPVAALPTLALTRDLRVAAWVNLAASAASLAGAVAMAVSVLRHGALTNAAFHVDAFGAYLVVMTAFIGLTTALFSRPYMAHVLRSGRIRPAGVRLYHAVYQAFMLTMLVALTTNNLGVLWVAMEGATLATVLLVSLYRTPAAVEAAWKYFILCDVGLALALFGTVLLYFAAQHALPDTASGLTWTVLHAHAGQLQPTVVAIAFVFLLVGYGTKVGLVPLHNWLPDAHSEGPTPISAVLSGLLLNVALYALVRMKMLADGALAASAHPQLAGHLMMGFGLVSFLAATLLLHRQRDIKRLFSYSSIEHMGLMTFGFGLGGPLATFAALLHMLVHALTKSSIFVSAGHASHIAGSQAMEHIRGLIRTQPGVGWGLLLGVVAIAGFPPFGLFTSEFLLITATLAYWPWLTAVLVLGLVIAFAGLFRHLHPMVYGPAPADQTPVAASMLPVLIQMALVLLLGLTIPAVLGHWLGNATSLIAGSNPL